MRVIYKTPINEKIGNAIIHAVRNKKIIEKFLLTKDEWIEWQQYINSDAACDEWIDCEMFLNSEIICNFDDDDDDDDDY